MSFAIVSAEKSDNIWISSSSLAQDFSYFGR
jgi:NADH/NAD ratio-sensing transcriptional regulator Rex